MANEVYTATTVSNPKAPFWLGPASEHLDTPRFALKILEVLLSLVAFVLEETVSTCLSCSPLYFFEFVSCTAFLFTALLLFLLSTTLHSRVGISCWPKVDFLYTLLIAVFFFIASIVFAANNGKTTVETIAVLFGFLAMVAFILDVILFLKVRGHPFQGAQAPPTTNGAVPPPEAEKLNGDANGTA
ncbi:CKLF-like MARVEL transmembrane domain-containing protein 4 [Poeciliopsis prolifica]|uniref:CKLF-like MARVEL transmembrane domain-containing protein 4 n=1 Tax=Poeciliopsis prolifica TaxID=188132 RepID=UPI00072D8BED|nr:CKLF-like MARVEL transmembrane domain-containing protein 4 [Poeciliopsis prolifica]XP_054916966.1 CKLF-like MARVEL transmembrane domain-containing protein 4 [Poeciliopsis prolifica]